MSVLGFAVSLVCFLALLVVIGHHQNIDEDDEIVWQDWQHDWDDYNPTMPGSYAHRMATWS